MSTRILVWTALVVMLAVSATMAGPIDLHAVEYPEKATVSLNLSPEPGAPNAKMQAKVTYKDGQAKIDLSYGAMKPAILYGGDITCYVVWAVTRDGEVYNLGELLAAKPKGSRQFTTANKSFALLVTAEPISLVRRPSNYPTFKNDEIKTKNAVSQTFRFSDFRPLTPARSVDSIVELIWDDTTPLELMQARKAYEIAGKLGGPTLAPRFYLDASAALNLANSAYQEKPKAREVVDYARRATALSFEAVNIAWARAEAILIEQELEAQRREMAQIDAQIRASRQQAAKAQKEAKVLGQQKNRLAALLRRSMSQVANTRDTAEGVVVSLPDILFELNKSTLKSDAKVVLAKLAGILLVMNDFQILVEGYTDSSGTPEYNKKLSKKRAEAVVSFMSKQGINPKRSSSIGYGIEKPIADNSTAEGRKQNRRVEIVLSGG